MLDTQSIKKDFPIFDHQPDLVYLDSGATTLKPRPVIQKIVEYYEKYSANIHRGVYKMSERATVEFEKAREIVASYINAPQANNVIFTRSTTEAINLIAYSLGRQIVGHGDEIVTTIMEHHSNFVPWQTLASENGATLKIINTDKDSHLDIGIQIHSGEIQIDKNIFRSIITRRTKILALTAVSNVLGVINPIKQIISLARQINPDIVVVVDGAQAVQSMPIDVTDLNCDFFVFSGHKIVGPTGIGVLYGKSKLLDEMYPFQYGGDMISSVAVEHTSFREAPYKFEAGTPHIAGAIGLGAAIQYISSIGTKAILEHERSLSKYAMKSLMQEFGQEVRVLGPKDETNRVGIVSFTFSKLHPHDIAQVLDDTNVAVRAGHHCAMPLHAHLAILASVRASFFAYNQISDIDALIEGMRRVKKLFSQEIIV